MQKQFLPVLLIFKSGDDAVRRYRIDCMTNLLGEYSETENIQRTQLWTPVNSKSGSFDCPFIIIFFCLKKNKEKTFQLREQNKFYDIFEVTLLTHLFILYQLYGTFSQNFHSIKQPQTPM